MEPRSRSGSGGYTLGVLADLLEGEYQSAVVGGMVEGAREAGVNILLLADSLRRAVVRGGARSDITYDLAGSDRVDGVIVMAGPLGNIVGLDELGRYCERFEPRPMCSVAAPVPGMAAILVDGAPALSQGVTHLVQDHGLRKIAFLGGPALNVEAQQRLATFRRTMADLGVEVPDEFVLSGEFRYEFGIEGVRVFLDERQIQPEAFVAGSDTIALGAIDALRIRGLQPPRDVAVLGFDDISDARYSVPSLTTVRQPLRRQGKLAVDVLLRRLRGEQVEKEYVLPAELIVRRSCGCYPDAHRPAPVATASAQAAAGHGGAEGALRRGRPRILKAMREAVGRQPDGFPADWEEALLEAAVVEAGGGEAGFIGRIRELLSETIGPAATGHPLRPALAALEHELLPCLVADEAMHRRAEERLAEAHFLVSEAIEDSHIHYRLMIERRRRSLSEATESLSAAFDLASLSDALRDSLPRLGVPSAYLVLDGSTGAGEARVVFAHDSRRNPLELEQLTCVPLQGMCLPDGLLPDDRTFAMVVEPLYFKDDRLGYAMFEMTARDAFTYDAFGALRVRISGAVKVALLIEELQVRVGQLRQAQKMETLGQLSGAIAHDFNNLLQAIRGYAELASLAPPGSPEAATDLEEIVRAADRASQLTRQLLTFSQPTRANARVVDLSSSVEQALPLIRRLLGPAIEITTSLSPDAGSILIDPAQLEQALINLCVNSRDAMREGGSLSIETGRKFVAGGPAAGAGLAAGRDLPAGLLSTVCIADTGAGIEPEIKERIFEPFFTTKDTGQGTGLGLSIVYGIVRGASGEITVESAVGRGTRVCLAFPTTTGTEESVEVPDGAMIRGSETILLVEDEDAIRKLARRVLIDAGYRVLSAANGEEARKLWATHEGRVDLLLTDVTMPRLSGVALASELTSGAARPPRMLFISGRLPGHEGGPELPAGAVFLPKPFSVAALLDAVRATLDSAPSKPGS